jgi:glycosyltransferase involved in cell wall biosynthesis
LFLVLLKSTAVKTVIINGSRRYIATSGSFCVWLLSRCFRKKVVVYVAGGTFHDYYRSLAPLARRLVRSALSSAHILTVQTRCSAASLRSVFSNLAVVPNWIDVANIQRMLGPRKRAEPGEKIRFVYAGELRAGKGILALLRAYRDVHDRLKPRGIEVSLDLIGPVWDDVREPLEVAMKEMPGIFLHGYQENRALLWQLAGCSVFVTPTLCDTEGHPGVAIEALAVGLPVIATSVGGIPEVIQDGENGLLCEPGNTEALAQAMTRLAEDVELRRRLSVGAWKSAMGFDTPTVLSEYAKTCGIPLHAPPVPGTGS